MQINVTFDQSDQQPADRFRVGGQLRGQLLRQSFHQQLHDEYLCRLR